jgi:hypothetical protein
MYSFPGKLNIIRIVNKFFAFMDGYLHLSQKHIVGEHTEQVKSISYLHAIFLRDQF